MSSRLLFLVPGGPGHVHNALGVVDEIVRRGHQVTVVTGGDFEAAVRRAGADFRRYRSAFDDVHVPDLMDEEDVEQLLNDVYIADNDAILRSGEEVAAIVEPDAIVYDEFHFIAGKVLAGKLNRPGIRLSGRASNEHYSFWEDMRESLGQRHPEEFETTRAELDALIAEGGFDRSIREFWDEVDDFTIVFIPRSFQSKGDTFDERFAFVGPCFTPDRLESTWTPPAGSPPILLVSLGTTFNEHPEFFRSCAEAFAGTPWHVVLAIGEHLDPASIGDLPPNVEAHGWISFLDVLGHAEVFLTHGTTGAVMAALYRGCPLLVHPDLAAEAEPTANQVLTMGLGRPIEPDELHPDALRRVVAEIAADAEVRRRVDEIRDEIEACGGSARAADVLLDHLASVTASATTATSVVGQVPHTA